MVVFYYHLVSSSFITLFTYLFLAALSLRCWAGFSLVAMSGGYSLVAVHRLLSFVVSLVEYRLYVGFCPCQLPGSRAQAQ